MVNKAHYSSLKIIVLAIIVLIIIATSLIKELDVHDNAQDVVQRDLSKNVDKILLNYYTNQSSYPSVSYLSELVRQMLGVSSAVPLFNGVGIDINKNDYLVATFVDEDCTQPTLSVDASVECVAALP